MSHGTSAFSCTSAGSRPGSTESGIPDVFCVGGALAGLVGTGLVGGGGGAGFGVGKDVSTGGGGGAGFGLVAAAMGVCHAPHDDAAAPVLPEGCPVDERLRFGGDRTLASLISGSPHLLCDEPVVGVFLTLEDAVSW